MSYRLSAIGFWLLAFGYRLLAFGERFVDFATHGPERLKGVFLSASEESRRQPCTFEGTRASHCCAQ
jgi:hypothetical protein